jgi:hypothetical protein
VSLQIYEKLAGFARLRQGSLRPSFESCRQFRGNSSGLLCCPIGRLYISQPSGLSSNSWLPTFASAANLTLEIVCRRTTLAKKLLKTQKHQIEMTDQQIYSKLFLLNSEQLKQDLLSYLEYLLSKQFHEEEAAAKKSPQFGCAKGKFRMSADFDAPLDHFNDYMPE